MKTNYEDLYWLAEPVEDFRARCAALDAREDQIGRDVQALAATRLNTDQLTRLSKTIARAHARKNGLSPLSPFRLAVLGNATTCLYVPTLAAAAARHGVALELIQADYDQVMQEALDPASRINTSRPDAVLLSLDFHGLPFADGDTVQPVLDQLLAIRDGLARGCGAPVILQTIACPPASLFGALDVRVESTMRRKVARFNDALVELAAGRGDYLLDIAAVAEAVGTQNWLDPVQWNLYKLPFSQRFVPIYAEHVGRVLGAIRGRSRKCVIFDLDNTLWGGVVGDDGLEGIKIGQGDGTSEAHLELQRVGLALRDRGIMLAVSSKNDDAVARRPFREHPDMLLKEQHISVFQANWNDKASNIEAIAKALNIGLDALVFVDDNPVERKQVREALPLVAVPELPADPSLYARTLLNAGYFEAISFSQEDRSRADQYQANARRAELEAGARNMDDFLVSLDMKLEMLPFSPVGAARVTQLINKTNQFNLTTRRYTEAEVNALIGSGSAVTMQVRLVDRFGDNGIIGVVIGRQRDETYDIETWLMSCRVLGRRVEEGVLAELVRIAHRNGIATLRGTYIPSEKNGMVSDHYGKLGFRLVADTDEMKQWELDVASYVANELPFEVVAPGIVEESRGAEKAA